MDNCGTVKFPRTSKYSSVEADKRRHIREQKMFVDFHILIGEHTFPCHKLVLATHSDFMEAMFNANMTEMSKQEVRLDHISVDIMNIILDYMYYGKVSFHKDQLLDLIAASDYLQVTELTQLCTAEVPAFLEPDNVISWWKQVEGVTNVGLTNVQDLCEEKMASDICKILSMKISVH